MLGKEVVVEEKVRFAPASEEDITRAIVETFAKEFIQFVESDCIVVGAGPSGLVAARDLARQGLRVLLVERNNYLGGGFWVGGYLMNKVTVRAPAQELLSALGVPLTEVQPGLFVADGPHACAKLIASACDAGVHVLNLTAVDDVVLREGNRVAGAVVNWAPVEALPRQITCVDPVALRSQVVIDATGHEAVVVRKLADRGLLELAGFSGMWVERSEDAVLEMTGEVHPGLVVAGMAVASTYGLPRMGPTFGAMLLSGRRAAEVVAERLLAAPAAV
jgi:thiamine thiazole synthase